MNLLNLRKLNDHDHRSSSSGFDTQDAAADDDFSGSLADFFQSVLPRLPRLGGGGRRLGNRHAESQSRIPRSSPVGAIFDRVDPQRCHRPTETSRQRNSRGEFRVARCAAVEGPQRSQGTVLRRLNRREYQNTLNDLFGTNLQFEKLLPEDGRSHEFDNVGEALNISMVQLQRYLDAIDSVIEASIANARLAT